MQFTLRKSISSWNINCLREEVKWWCSLGIPYLFSFYIHCVVPSWVSALRGTTQHLSCGRTSQSTWALYWQDSPSPFQLWGCTSCSWAVNPSGCVLWKQWLRTLSQALLSSVSMGTSVDVLSRSESREKKSIKSCSLCKCESITSCILSFCRKQNYCLFSLN